MPVRVLSFFCLQNPEPPALALEPQAASRTWELPPPVLRGNRLKPGLGA
jgi:hypothetical protein